MYVMCLFQSLELLFQFWTWMTHLSRRMTLQKLLKRSLKRQCLHMALRSLILSLMTVSREQ
uniref:Uncharacterized protein n=1 Tax=Setaria viridis TaxID=4556 RepID=A0A4U6SSA4_SETVI|nr:hypothetical protein SEVIR_9G068450v2 [Setaria viridis]